jgi:hypothetical protein
MNGTELNDAPAARSVDQQQACSPIARLAAALLDSKQVMVIGDGCSTRSRDLWILTDIIGKHLEPKKRPPCDEGCDGHGRIYVAPLTYRRCSACDGKANRE